MEGDYTHDSALSRLLAQCRCYNSYHQAITEEHPVSGTFEQWLQASFDHAPPTTAKEQDWYWDEGFELFWNPLCITDAVAVRYMTRLFLESERLNVYWLEQVAEGIWFLIGGSSPSRSSQALLNPALRLDERVACIDSMTEFFRSFVAPATQGLAYTESDPFQGACVMWWDHFHYAHFTETCLSVNLNFMKPV
jgi:hypothetical protein